MMVLGEYEFNDMFDGRFDDMPYAYAFNLALLTLLAIIGRYTTRIHYHNNLYHDKGIIFVHQTLHYYLR